jgi:xanthine/CO dehydrogenase XdhC/CoxF family maturation factor
MMGDRGRMKRWVETKAVLDRLALWTGEGRAAALATVVNVSGSAYRSPGAKLLVASDGSTCGNVSGGCLEEDVREVALRVMMSGRPELRTYCTGAGEVHAWDLGVGIHVGLASPIEQDVRRLAAQPGIIGRREVEPFDRALARLGQR